MRRRFAALTALIALMLVGVCLTAHAQSVRFVNPTDGDTVRDIVRIQATKQNADSGWISYRIENGGSGDFVAAVSSPFNYTWDTRARNEQGKEIYPDGQYTLTAVALSASGRKKGEATITVTLKNSVSASRAPRRVDLNLFYDRNQEVYYRADGDWGISPTDEEEKPDDVYELAKVYNGKLVANWKNKVMSPTYAGGHAILHVIVGSSGAQVGKGDVQALDNAGDVVTYRALADGEMRKKHSDEPSFPLAEISVPLRGRAVKVGDSWNGRIEIWPDPLKGTMGGGAGAGGMGEGMGMGGEMGMPGEMGPMGGMPGEAMGGMEGGMEGAGAGGGAEATAPTEVETERIQAKHTVEGFEWVNGYPTVRIRSTFSKDRAKVTVPSAPTSGGVGGAMGEEFGGPAGEMGMGPGMEFGDTGVGGGEMGAGGMGGGQGAEKESSYVGERMTYWSWDLHRPIRIVDTITHTLEIERGSQGMGGGEMGMQPGMEGMPMEGAMPPGMEPGMEPGPGMGETQVKPNRRLNREELAQLGIDVEQMAEAAGAPGQAGPGAEGARPTVRQVAQRMGISPAQLERRLGNAGPGMEPGMGPGGYGPGGFGGETGMQQQEPAEPMKVKIRVRLTIQEVNR